MTRLIKNANGDFLFLVLDSLDYFEINLSENIIQSATAFPPYDCDTDITKTAKLNLIIEGEK